MDLLQDPASLATTVAVRLGGSGGQGLILAGRLLAEAAALYDGLDVVQINSYGPEARGGASRSEVVIGHGQIDVLHPPKVEVLVCLSQAACDAYYHDLRHDGLLITDADLVKVVPTSRAIEVPMSRLAKKELGTAMVANVVSLGVLCTTTQVVTREALRQAILNRVPPAHRETNGKALDLGFTLGENALSRLTKKVRALVPDFSSLRQAPSERPAITEAEALVGAPLARQADAPAPAAED
jgi:2-oxoglutarate ferredoxin oxidoreductase subunit gamma